MRRTSATKILAAAAAQIHLDALSCEVCGGSCGRDGTVVVIATGANGADERCFCSITCARSVGWPWLHGETVRTTKHGVNP